MKYKVLCPNDKAHRGYTKTLFIFEPSRNGTPSKLYLHCDDMHCKSWMRIEFNDLGGVRIIKLPKDYHIDFERCPTLVSGEFERKSYVPRH